MQNTWINETEICAMLVDENGDTVIRMNRESGELNIDWSSDSCRNEQYDKAGSRFEFEASVRDNMRAVENQLMPRVHDR